MPRSTLPAVCAQCGCDFTPVWRWERAPTRRLDATFTPPHPPATARRLCELCVSGNVKRALKSSSRERSSRSAAAPAAVGTSSPAPPAPPSPAAKPQSQASATRPLSSSESLRGHHSERAREPSEVPAKKGK
ncbi:Uncharacterized protein OBRU01_02353, partial [Operophtera brumata]